MLGSPNNTQLTGPVRGINQISSSFRALLARVFNMTPEAYPPTLKSVGNRARHRKPREPEDDQDATDHPSKTVHAPHHSPRASGSKKPPAEEQNQARRAAHRQKLSRLRSTPGSRALRSDSSPASLDRVSKDQGITVHIPLPTPPTRHLTNTHEARRSGCLLCCAHTLADEPRCPREGLSDDPRDSTPCPAHTDSEDGQPVLLGLRRAQSRAAHAQLVEIGPAHQLRPGTQPANR